MIQVSLTLLLLTVFIIDTIFTIILSLWTAKVSDERDNLDESLLCGLSWSVFLLFNFILIFNINEK